MFLSAEFPYGPMKIKFKSIMDLVSKDLTLLLYGFYAGFCGPIIALEFL